MKSSTNRGGHNANPLFSAFVKALLSVMLLLVGNVAVKAADFTSAKSVTFNEGVRYSQWVIDSRLSDFWANSKQMGFNVLDKDGNVVKSSANSGNLKFDYVPGLVAKAVLEAQAFYDTFDWSKPWFKTVEKYATDKKYTVHNSDTKSAITLDNMNACKMYFPLMASSTASSNVKTIGEKAIADVITDMGIYNGYYVIGGAESGLKEATATDAQKKLLGGWWHKPAYTDQMWCDGLYMGPALLAQIINYTNSETNVDATSDWDLITKQFTISWSQLNAAYGVNDGVLLYHAFAANPGDANSSYWTGIDKVNHSEAFWGRACGWYFLALVDVLEQMPTDNKNYATLKGYLEKLAAGLKNCQDDASGCWYQVLDEKEKPLSGNYLESSCTAIFTAAYLKAMRLGLLDRATYEATAIKAYKGFVEQFMKYDTDGTVQLIHNCKTAGLSGTNKRNGSRAYYVDQNDEAAQSNGYTEGKVLGAFILAATEYEREYQNASVLLHKDLAPSYSLKKGESLSIEASGSGFVTYQWYKGTYDSSTAITDATSASYTPTESGSYYCIVSPAARAAGTIQSSIAEVTVEGNADLTPSDNATISWTEMATTGHNANKAGVSTNTAITATDGVVNGLTTDNNKTTCNNNVTYYRYTGVPGSENTNIYFQYSYTVEDGYTFTPSKVSVSWSPANSSSVGIQVYGSSDGTTYSKIGSFLKRNKDKTYGTDELDVTSNYKYIRIVPYGNTKQIILNDVVITGTLSSGSTEPTTYAVTYNANGHGTDPAAETGVISLTQAMLDVTMDDVDGYTFKGWYTEAACTNVATPIATLTTDVELFAKWEKAVMSSETTPSIEGATLDGTTLTVPALESTATGREQTINVTLPKGATATVTSDGGDTFADGVLTYTAPAAGNSKDITLQVTAEDGKTKVTYTIKIVTNAKPGSMTEYTGTFTLDQLKTFGSRSNDVSQITSDDDALTLTAVAGITSGKNIEATGSDTGGAKMQTTSSFVLKSVEGVKIKKVSVTTTTMGRSLTATSTTTSSSKGEQSASDNKIWEYTFNSIEEAITFKNENADNINVLRINVVYEKAVGDGKTALSAKFSKDVLEWYVNDAMPTEPTLTVTPAGTAFDAYCVKYTSSNTNIVTVAADGKLTLKEGTKGGTAVITAEVTPTDEIYVGTSTVYTVNVKPLEVPTVYAHDITVYNTTGVQPQPVVDIYVTDAEGKRVILDKRYYELSYAKESGDDIIIGTGGQFVLAGEAGNWTTGSAVVRVTCKPTDEAAKLYHITEADATFNVKVVSAGDKLIPKLGGVTEATMNVSTTRDFVKSVLYDGVDITSGFNCTYTIAENGVTGSSVSKKSNGVLELKAGTLTTAGTPGTVTITVTATANGDYSSQYANITDVDNTIVVTVIDGKELQSVDITPKTINANVGDVLQDFVVVVKDENGNPVPEDDYTMVWGSSASGVVAVVGDRSQGIFDAVSEGTAIVRVYIKKEGYADMKGECSVTVKDPGMFKVTNGLKYAKGTPFDVDGLTLTLGGWMFKANLAASHGTTSEKLGEGDWGGTTDKYKKPLGFTHNIEMGTHKNARQEFGSNCQLESNYIYNAKIEKQDYELLDPMFNVPCSGSYLAFSPKTTGTVTVYIRQKGVFENNGGDHVYRPQRRVFVMDEMGQFVTSTPKLEYPTGWNDNNLGDKGTVFTCDILTNNDLIGNSSRKESGIYELALNKKISDLAGYSPSPDDKKKVQDWIMKHFYGLKNFNIDNFRNGVYASDLSIDITKNQAQSNHQTDQAARGWCVLTAAPVSYKFDVKPGKTYYLYNFGSKIGLYGFSFRKGTPTVDNREWSENSTPEISETEANHVAKVSIDREFKTGIWNACVLPFSMNRQQVNAVFGKCYDNENTAGTQILYFDRVEGGTIHFVRHAYNTIVAGKPFLIKPSKTDGAIKIASENMGDYPYVTIEKTAAENFGRDKETANYYWTSSYNSFGVAPGDYFLRDTEINGKQADGNIVRYPKTMTGELPMGGFRGYLTAKTDALRQSAKSLTIAINDFESDETTYIENVEIADDGTLRQRINGKVYNLQGQLVSDDASQLDCLPKGIYIVNGKKVSVK